MTIHIALTHLTRYQYERPAQLGPQIVRLRPAPHSRTPVLSYALDIEPKNHFINWQQDPHGNFLARLVFPEPVDALQIRVNLVADMAVFNPFDFFLEPDAETFPFAYQPELAQDLEPYLETEPAGPRLQAWLDGVDRTSEAQLVSFLVALNQRLQQDISYVIRMEPGIQRTEDTLKLRSGSCRDSAWLLVQILRHLGIAARFVSGYLIQLVADQPALDGPSGPTEDFTDLHAWTEAFLPGAGWVGLDPTSGLLAGEGHIPLAATPHPTGAAPITGLVEPMAVTFDFDMSISRIFESPRVTKPYTETEWQAIDACGRALDSELAAGDVRLTLGGEPTFVSIDEPNSAEWNTEALGPHKYNLALDLIQRLRQRYAPLGALHFGQGKWYPGEQLPRWAISLYWRADGEPIWLNPEQVAGQPDPALNEDNARELAEAVASYLQVDPAAVLPAYEDPWHFIGSERKLPTNLDPLDNKLTDPMARERLARVFERGLDRPTGYVLPVQRWQTAHQPPRWITEVWQTRSGRLWLWPGESPIGLRLQMDGLPYLRPAEFPHIYPEDPFTTRVALQPRAVMSPDGQAGPAETLTPSGTSSTGAPVRAAMGFEVRDGFLCVFMPPVATLEDYLELLAVVETAAASTGYRIRLEGYPPPPDARLNVLKVTPDPGVIEVNVQPAGSWQELCSHTSTLYECARQSRLDVQKFMLDGRHTGTGGGNHVVLGGRTAADSPFLRRPDLLRSLIACWQQHPSLSYLFSGLFIGPTSQAPRIDEAREDQLYELALAFAQIPEPEQAAPPPWLVDRIFRNLLVDVSGNTHRTEICIDKLYSPDGPTGRLGLVEFRAFEMPPNAAMSLTQHLLLLALIARFWKSPNRQALVPWGNRLHDEYMLPHYVWSDFLAVIDELNAAGYPLSARWFAPHLEFRFPVYGSIQYQDMTLELRQALEPWHVMGEEGAVGGTVRYVDSSLERLQVKVSSWIAERYQVLCNGIVLPLQPTATAGEYVAGVRFRAWQPAASLHPTLGVDAPLNFEIFDRWSQRAVAACTYHVAHPGGRNFEHFPVNANEAESRRLSRFQPFGSRSATVEPRTIDNPSFPHTLDLRLAKRAASPGQGRAP